MINLFKKILRQTNEIRTEIHDNYKKVCIQRDNNQLRSRQRSNLERMENW